MKQRLLSLPVENVPLIMGKEAADWWSLHSFLKEMEDRCQFHWLQTEVANPNQQDVKEALESLGAKPLDVIVAIGGGSVIDLAKAISAFYDPKRNASYTAEEITEAIRRKSYQNRAEFVDIIAVPSTAGTGSEVTQWATVWDLGKTSKFSIDAPGLKPRLALIVPDLTLTAAKAFNPVYCAGCGGSCNGSVLVQAHYPLGKRFLLRSASSNYSESESGFKGTETLRIS